MKQKMIMLDEIHINKLRNYNASELIRGLLNKHFVEDSENLEEINIKINELKAEKEKYLLDFEAELSKMEYRKTLIKRKTEEIQKKEHKNKEKEKEKIETIKAYFKEQTNREIKEEELKEYLKRMKDEERGFNLFTFIDEKINNKKRENAK